MKENLRSFADEPTFLANSEYTGYGEPKRLVGAQNEIRNLALDLVKKGQFSKTWFFDRCESAWSYFEMDDTEDREKVISYFEQMMDILEIKSSDGRLNNMLYGPLAAPNVEQ